MVVTADVLVSGAVCLGSSVVCDGFAEGYPYRVQTHIHDDHMGDFDKSKGLQDILMSSETHALLVADRNAELEMRDNLHQIDHGTEYSLNDGIKVVLSPSNHMLGSCQVAIILPNCLRVGYSGDFGWPLDEVIQVDVLVLDSTYGSTRSVRHYTQEDAEGCLWDIVNERLRHGPVHINAYRGTIERVLHILGDNVGVPILASERLIREVKVYQNFGFAVGMLNDISSDVGQLAMKERSYVRLYSKGDGFGNVPRAGTTVVCSAFMVSGDHPLMAFTERSYSVALSNHADFNETLKYVEATGARKVVTDNTRNHGIELAVAIKEKFPNVTAVPSTNSIKVDSKSGSYCGVD